MADTISTQRLIDCHINAFGLELFLESLWAAWAREKDQKPLTFIYRGVKVTLDPVECPEHIKRQIARRAAAPPPAAERITLVVNEDGSTRQAME